MPLKARYENKVLKPLEKLDLTEGDVYKTEGRIYPLKKD
ncbi:antitoxin AF2212-like protein [Methanothrix sp.]|jgi:predicted DNA-binding antitoxin AbrB/MazE fold protein